MNIPHNSSIRKQANEIALRYSKWIPMKDIQNFYAELAAISITVGLLIGESTHCEWYYNGALVENSWFNLTCYKGAADDGRAEYTIYFS